MNRKAMAGGVAAAAIAGAMLFGGCSSSPSNSSAGSTTSTTEGAAASCTHSAILTAATNDTSLGPVSAVQGFGCSGKWAYANVTVGSGSNAVDAVIVLKTHGSSWKVADRAHVCSKHKVPTHIYTQACTTS